MAARIFLVDDDVDLRNSLLEVFQTRDLSAKIFSSGEQLLEVLEPEWNGVVLSDVRMPWMDGFELLEKVKRKAPHVPFVMITGYGDVKAAIRAIRAGAFDYLEKTSHPEHLISVVVRALEMRDLQIQNWRLSRRFVAGENVRSRLLGKSDAIRECRRQILRVSLLPIDVLFHGESGTGKELAARCLHSHSNAGGDFVVVSCGAERGHGFYEHLFARHSGDASPVEQAENGVLYLENIDALKPAGQLDLASFIDLDDRPRVIASVRGSPGELTRSGQLLDELYFRLNVGEIHMAPLRDRGGDKFLLVEFFLREAASQYRRAAPSLSPEILDGFESYDWPGNVRELRNLAERLVIGLPVEFNSSQQKEMELPMGGYDAAMQNFEKSLLVNALRRTYGRRGEAAAFLGIPRKRLYLRMRAVGLSGGFAPGP